MAVAMIFTINATPAHAQLVTDDGVDLRPLMFPAKSQSGARACVFFALAAAMETFPGIPKLSESLPYIHYILEKNKNSDSFVDNISLEELHEIIQNKKIFFNNETSFNSFENIFYNLAPAIKTQYNLKQSDSTAVFDLLKEKFTFEKGYEDNRTYNLKLGGTEKLYFDNREKKGYYLPEKVSFFDKSKISSDLIKDALKNKKPIIVSINYKPDEWNSSYSNANTLANTDITRFGEIGFKNKFRKRKYKYADILHAITIVGYKTKITKKGGETEYIFRNSWGKDWGMLGNGFITEEYLLNNISSALIIENAVSILEHPRFDQYGPKIDADYGRPIFTGDESDDFFKDLLLDDHVGINLNHDLKINFIKNNDNSLTMLFSPISYFNSTIPKDITFSFISKKNGDYEKQKIITKFNPIFQKNIEFPELHSQIFGLHDFYFIKNEHVKFTENNTNFLGNEIYDYNNYHIKFDISSEKDAFHVNFEKNGWIYKNDDLYRKYDSLMPKIFTTWYPTETY
jgi:hypothetical protein